MQENRSGGSARTPTHLIKKKNMSVLLIIELAAELGIQVATEAGFIKCARCGEACNNLTSTSVPQVCTSHKEVVCSGCYVRHKCYFDRSKLLKK